MRATFVSAVGLAVALMVPVGAASGQSLMGTAFTYQGHLTDNGAPGNGEYDFQFRLCRDVACADVVDTVVKENESVTDGLFTVELDFGDDAFTGDARWLELGVRAGNSDPEDPYEILDPRQELTPAPHALALPGVYTQQNATSPNVIGGYSGNSVQAGVVGATIGGGGTSEYANLVTEDYGTVSGGLGNTASGLGTVGGGRHNEAVEYFATVGGGEYNSASQHSTVGGGHDNTASQFATVGGGECNSASRHSTVGGGHDNSASQFATVGGGECNTADLAAIVGGGYGNTAGAYSTVGGGECNTADVVATVGGGSKNTASVYFSTVSGGESNEALGYWATVGGGLHNTASGDHSVVPGGESNTAGGAWSLAAGRQATIDAAHAGTFVWADSSEFDFFSTVPDEFSARATGGVRFVTEIDGSGGVMAGVALGPGDTAWSPLSDRDLKENFVPADGCEILDRLASVPIGVWNFKHQDSSLRHIGPIAQDFHAAFEVGRDDRHISTIDADGVALAAIQGLHEIVKEKECQFEAVRAEKDAQIAELAERLAALEKLVTQADADRKGGVR